MSNADGLLSQLALPDQLTGYEAGLCKQRLVAFRMLKANCLI